MSSEQEVKNFKKNLDNDKQEQNFFVNSEVSDEDDDNNLSDTDILENETITIVPSSKMDSVLLQQLFKQQNVVLNAQRTIYKLKNEINKEELKMRYLKLDLNNTECDLENSQEQASDLQLELYISKSETYMYRGLTFLYFAYTIATYFL
jgi:hypothetical protein